MDWKNLERHPLSAEYPNLNGRTWTRYVEGVRDRGILNDRKIMLYEKRVIDGWQLQRACVELDKKPKYEQLKLPKGVTLEDWLETVQDLRRHEGQAQAEKRIEERRAKVATARVGGQSLRAIAEAEGVSEATVRSDLSSSTAQGCAVEPPDGKVTSLDGKQRPATKAKKLCDRCQRVGPVKNCPVCRDLRSTGKKRPPKPEVAEDDKKDCFGNAVPKRCRDALFDPWVQDAFDFLCVQGEKFRMERLADGMDKRKKRYPFFNSVDFVDGCRFIIQYFDALTKHVKEQRPAGVCPACEGKGCGECKSSGLVPRTEYQKLAKAKK